MFKTLATIGLSWFVYTKTGRHIAKNICLNAVPYIEKELGIDIIKPIKELRKEPKGDTKDVL